jgi:hypothetical protein
MTTRDVYVVMYAQPVDGEPGSWVVEEQFYDDGSEVPTTTVYVKYEASSADEAVNEADATLNDALDPPDDGDSGGGAGGGDNGGCYATGTLIAAERGPVRIERLRVGDRVYSFDRKRNEPLLRHIIGTYTGLGNEAYVLHFGKRKLVCSPRHRFYSEGKWLRASELKPGNRLTGRSGKAFELRTVTTKKGFLAFHHITVGNTRNYYAVHTLDDPVHTLDDDDGDDGFGGVFSQK